MATRKMAMSLAKLVIATAWVDGEVKASEVNVLKDLIYSWGDVSEEEWTMLEAYMDAPVRDPERQRLLDEVLSQVTSKKDKELVVGTLSRLVECDGEVTEEERQALDEIEQAVDSKSTGLGTLLSSLVGGAVSRRSAIAEESPAREERLDDFIRNKIYFQLVSEMESRQDISIDLPEREVRKLCLAGGMLAQVAFIDEDVDQHEKKELQRVLRREWDISSEAAELVTEISVDRAVRGLDQFRLTRTFFELTDHDERRRFLFNLFKVANAADKTSFEEIEKIRKLSRALKLPHDDFIAAKLSIDSEDRKGL
ncbi:MAG TPA: TerB family tellurite resistance protein [Acidobacteriota bacterium]|nr:TerB family tellurite resistance protein [Acidobacteriota bacterium]